MPDRTRPTLIMAGGFLGAGKTTLLLAAARLLYNRGLRTALITNDQGGSLVDTRMAIASGLQVGEIAGACFCCRFSDLITTARNLLPLEPDVIVAEPVGSCIDISATVLQPIKQYHGDQFRLAPFSVLVDPGRAAELLRSDADPHLAYLFRNQLAEADLVVFTKSDLHKDVPELPGIATRRLSARTGEGVAEWLGEVLSGRLSAGSHLLDVDYSRYAAAEAELGWLNWEGELQLRAASTPAGVVGPLIDYLDRELTHSSVAIAHLKIFDGTPTGYIKAGICRNGEEPSIEGDLLAAPSRRHEVVVNLRARAAPDLLEDTVLAAIEAIPGNVRVLHHQSFRPAPPKPE